MVDYDDAGAILSEMVQIGRTFQVANQRSKEGNFTGTKFRFLQHLRHTDARLGDLAQRHMVSASVASRAIDALEADGMVVRAVDRRDARALHISITEKGIAKLTEGESQVVQRFAQALADWSPADAGNAVAMLKRLNGHLAEVTGPPVASEE